MDISFTPTRGLSHKHIATIFASYITPFSVGMPQRMGSVDREEEDEDDYSRWMLDAGNNYWLKFEDGKGFLQCRYPEKREFLQAMVALFELGWGR